jgi:hypothetical protein
MNISAAALKIRRMKLLLCTSVSPLGVISADDLTPHAEPFFTHRSRLCPPCDVLSNLTTVPYFVLRLSQQTRRLGLPSLGEN